MKMDIDDSHELYKRINENQANYLIDRDFPKNQLVVLTQ